MNIIEQLLNIFRRKKNMPHATDESIPGISSHREMESWGAPDTSSPLNQRQMESIASEPPGAYTGGSKVELTVQNPATGVTTTHLESGAVVAQAAGQTPYRVKAPDSANDAQPEMTHRQMETASAQTGNDITGAPPVTMSEEAQVQVTGYGLPDLNDNKDTRNMPSGATNNLSLDDKDARNSTPEALELQRQADLDRRRLEHLAASHGEEVDSTISSGVHGGPINGVDTTVPTGMVGTPDGLVMNQETALKSAGLDMTGLADFTPSSSGPAPEAPTTSSSVVTSKGASIQAIEEAIASPYDNQVYEAQQLSLAQQRLDSGRQQRLDPDRDMSGGSSFGDSRPSENPVVDFGGDPGSTGHQAV